LVKHGAESLQRGVGGIVGKNQFVGVSEQVFGFQPVIAALVCPPVVFAVTLVFAVNDIRGDLFLRFRRKRGIRYVNYAVSYGF